MSEDRFRKTGTLAERETIELELLLEGIFRLYGADFRHYARASLRRRVLNMLREEKLESISTLQAKVLHDPDAMERLLLHLSVNVTTMFRDPAFFLAFRQKVIPHLFAHPFVRIWHAGCSTGEEVYSLAIVLQEEGLYERARIYATDMNPVVIEKAKAGIFPLDQMQEFTQNYVRAGGKAAFSDYYTAQYDHAIFKSSLKKNIVFAQHNLAQDNSFNEFNVILCRNVMIYFDTDLQNRVHGLLHASLRRFGVLALGRRETIKHTLHEKDYEPIDETERLYPEARVSAPPEGSGARPRALVAIGASWGGVDALKFVIAAMTPDFPAPVVVVQHRGDDGDDQLEQVLRQDAVVDVREAEDKEPLVAGKVYVAPSGYHLLVDGDLLALSTDGPVAWARPSIDVLFESVAESFRARAIGVILTGKGTDGPNGLVAIKSRGGLTVVQDPSTAESRVLPDAALAAVKADKVLKLAELVPFLSRHVRELSSR